MQLNNKNLGHRIKTKYRMDGKKERKIENVTPLVNNQDQLSPTLNGHET